MSVLAHVEVKEGKLVGILEDGRHFSLNPQPEHGFFHCLEGVKDDSRFVADSRDEAEGDLEGFYLCAWKPKSVGAGDHVLIMPYSQYTKAK